MANCDFRVVHDAMALTGECPLWDEQRRTLWWIDIQGQRLLGHRPGAEPHRPIPLPSMPGLVALSDDGNLILGLEDGLWHFVPEQRQFRRLSDIEPDKPQNRLNDGKPDRDGRLWFGSMEKSGMGGAVGGLYCRSADGSILSILTGITVPNAIAISPDGRSLYFADSPSQEILIFDLDRQTGALTNRRVFVRFAGAEKPDGASMDIDGGLWVAVVDGWRVDRFNPDGSLELSLKVPVSRPTMPAFGGDDMRTLFVTSQRRFLTSDALFAQPAAGALIAARVGREGMKPFKVAISDRVGG